MEEEQNRNPLEYRPSFQRSQRERTAWEVGEPSSPPSSGGSSKEPDIGNGVVTDIVKDTLDTLEKLEEKLEELKNQLKEKPVPVPEEYGSDIKEAKKELGLPEGPFTFEDYIHALENWESPAGDYLTEVAERYFEGVNGTLPLELYQDYYELVREQKLLLDYIQRSLSPILPEASWERSEEDWEKAFREQEENWGSRRDKILQEKKRIEEDYRTAFLHSPDKLSSKRNLRYEQEEAYRDIQNQYNRMQDTLLIAQNKTRDINRLFNEGEELLEEGWSAREEELVRAAFQETIENTKEGGLTQASLMLTLAVENRNDEKHHRKHALRNTYAIEKQRRVLDELTLYQSLYDRETLPLLHSLRVYQEEQPAVVSHFLESMTFAMGNVAKEKEKRMLDWQNIQSATSILRLQKLQEVEKKENARRGYQLIHSLQEKNG